MRVFTVSGEFAGDKDAAASIREDYIRATLAKGKRVVLDFAGVDLATQSFIHALIAGVVRDDPDSLDQVDFKNCNESVRSLIEIVVEYAQDEFE